MISDPVDDHDDSTSPMHRLELGAASGIAAGLVYLVAASVIAHLAGGHLASPLRLPAAVIFGPAALGSFFPVWRAALAGAGMDLALSGILGIFWVMSLSRARLLRAGPVVLAPLGVAYGALVWLAGNVLLGSLALPQIAVADLLWNGVVAHAIFFGGALAAAVLLLRSSLEGN